MGWYLSYVYNWPCSFPWPSFWWFALPLQGYLTVSFILVRVRVCVCMYMCICFVHCFVFKTMYPAISTLAWTLLCSLDWSPTRHALPLPSKCWDYICTPPYPTSFLVFWYSVPLFYFILFLFLSVLGF
jgi:hypothetical protein